MPKSDLNRGEWPCWLRCYGKNWKVPGSLLTRFSARVRYMFLHYRFLSLLFFLRILLKFLKTINKTSSRLFLIFCLMFFNGETFIYANKANSWNPRTSSSCLICNCVRKKCFKLVSQKYYVITYDCPLRNIWDM